MRQRPLVHRPRPVRAGGLLLVLAASGAAGAIALAAGGGVRHAFLAVGVAGALAAAMLLHRLVQAHRP